ncbi:MAG: RNA-binding cell elongation regulator Jag/EloR [Chloroflexota bacterium]
MTFREFTGKNVEEAIRTAMREYTADLSDLDIEILSQGSRGILGVGGEEARILAAPKSAVEAAPIARPAPEPRREPEPAVVAEPTAVVEEVTQPDADAVGTPLGYGDTEASGEPFVESADAPAPRRSGSSRGGRGGAGRTRGGYGSDRADRPARERREPRADREPRGDRPMREPAPFVSAKPLEELSDEERAVVEQAKAVLEELLRLMGIPAEVEVALGAETAKLNVKGGELGILIGRRGEKLASLQHIVNLIVQRKEGQGLRIAVDVENYRGRREEQLREVAERAAKRVQQTGKIIQLEPMPAVERRIVHMALKENTRIRTQSVGVEPSRRIVILPASQAE